MKATIINPSTSTEYKLPQNQKKPVTHTTRVMAIRIFNIIFNKRLPYFFQNSDQRIASALHNKGKALHKSQVRPVDIGIKSGR